MSESIYQPPSPEASPTTNSGAVAAQSWKTRLFGFQGRFSRSQFWGYGFGFSQLVGLAVILPMVPIFISLARLEEQPDSAVNIPLLVICGLLLLAISIVSSWIYLAGVVKRFHDRGKSGHWAWIILIPYVGGIWILIECGCLEGMRNQPNLYGPDPLLG